MKIWVLGSSCAVRMCLFLLPHDFTGIQLEKVSQNEGWGGICRELGVALKLIYRFLEKQKSEKVDGEESGNTSFLSHS